MTSLFWDSPDPYSSKGRKNPGMACASWPENLTQKINVCLSGCFPSKLWVSHGAAQMTRMTRGPLIYAFSACFSYLYMHLRFQSVFDLLRMEGVHVICVCVHYIHLNVNMSEREEGEGERERERERN